MPQNRRKNIIARRATISRLYLEGKTGLEISGLVNVSPSQVSRDLGIIAKGWRESAARDIGEKKARDLAELEMVRRELWESWNQSKQEKGDPRYVSELLKALKQSAELLGLNAPEKSSIAIDVERILDMGPPEIVDLLYDRIMSIQKDNER